LVGDTHRGFYDQERTLIGQIFHNAINAGRLAKRYGAGFQDPPALHCSTVFHLKKPRPRPGPPIGSRAATPRIESSWHHLR
jgi:hypothetical protein